jgi:hypothetical protein
MANRATADASGIAGGLIGVGFSVATATANGASRATIGDATVDAANVTVDASANNSATADSQSVSGGIFGTGGNGANATVSPVVEAAIRSGATITATNA